MHYDIEAKTILTLQHDVDIIKHLSWLIMDELLVSRYEIGHNI